MRIDAQVKTGFPIIVGIALLCTAYLQALGLGHLFAARLQNGPVYTPHRGNADSLQAASGSDRTVRGDAILARNPFDSTVGPLDGKKESSTVGADSSDNGMDPYADPICAAGRVLLITTADEPSWSFAAIAMGREKATLRRIGDGLGDQTVLAMVWDRVWLVKEGRRCQLPLGKVASEKTVDPIPPGPIGIADKIRHIADNRFEVERSIIETVSTDYRKFFRGVSFVPVRDAEGAGLKISGIKSGSVLSMLGLMNGDKLQTINGFEISDPTIAIQAYGRLLTADRLEVRLVRAGRPMSIDVTLR